MSAPKWLQRVEAEQGRHADIAESMRYGTARGKPGPAKSRAEARANRELHAERYNQLEGALKVLLGGRYIEKRYVQPRYPKRHNEQYGPWYGKMIRGVLRQARDEGFLTRAGYRSNRDEIRWRLGGRGQVTRKLVGGDARHRGKRIYKSGAQNRWRLPGPPPPPPWEEG